MSIITICIHSERRFRRKNTRINATLYKNNNQILLGAADDVQNQKLILYIVITLLNTEPNHFGHC
jgi:hypothetical protein